ncbi:MAG: hypothetical protein RMN24_11235, partial [Anaerolineae bacterium]|nr:hypothetical protein [Anaerolineae bacterium]
MRTAAAKGRALLLWLWVVVLVAGQPGLWPAGVTAQEGAPATPTPATAAAPPGGRVFVPLWVQGRPPRQSGVDEGAATAPLTDTAPLTETLPLTDTAWLTATVTGAEAATGWLPPGGGVWWGRGGRVAVMAPAGAVTRPVRIVMEDAAVGTRSLPELIEVFRLTVRDDAARAVERFARPVRVVLNLIAYEALLRGRQGSPTVYRWDEENGAWVALPTEVDWGTGRAWATVTESGLLAVGTAQTLSFGAQHLPTVHGFVTDTWTGNSSIVYPLTLPPGPGGLGLNLNLRYSSEGVNSIRQGTSLYTDTNGTVINRDQQNAGAFLRQAGLAGWGWNLEGLGQVTVQIGGPDQGRAWLGYAGGGYELKLVNGRWQTDPQSFLRIEHQGDVFAVSPWVVWAPDGTKYTFGGEGSVAWVVNRDANNNCYRLARELHLSAVEDTHGNKVTVSYGLETKDLPGGYCANNYAPYNQYVRAIRPLAIAYLAASEPLATVQVDFGYSTRSDTGVPGQNDPYVESFWSVHRLTSIAVKVRNGASSFATARTYVLEHAYLWKDSAAGQGLLLLQRITEQGRNGGALPAWTFTYTTGTGDTLNAAWLNHTLLREANNGQGGKVSFTYANESQVWMHDCGAYTSRYRVSQQTLTDGLGTAAHNHIVTIYNYQHPWAWGQERPECTRQFEFGGHTFVRRRLQDGAGALSRVVDDYFHQKQADNSIDPRKGKVYRSVTSSEVASGELARVETTWATAVVEGTNWVYKADETRRLGNAFQKTVYEYQAALQGGQQYGNVTH